MARRRPDRRLRQRWPDASRRLRDGHDLAEGGRGLLVVDALAARWGSFRTAPAQVVWCDLGQPLPAATAEAWAWLNAALAGSALGAGPGMPRAAEPGCARRAFPGPAGLSWPAAVGARAETGHEPSHHRAAGAQQIAHSGDKASRDWPVTRAPGRCG